MYLRFSFIFSFHKWKFYAMHEFDIKKLLKFLSVGQLNDFKYTE